jgi:hypothetical protein
MTADNNHVEYYAEGRVKKGSVCWEGESESG